MSNQPLPSDCTATQFEQAALSRFRALVTFLPSNCRVFREPWDCSTVLCLDFSQCPTFLESTKAQSLILQAVVQELGLARALIFRVEQKSMGWVRIDF